MRANPVSNERSNPSQTPPRRGRSKFAQQPWLAAVLLLAPLTLAPRCDTGVVGEEVACGSSGEVCAPNEFCDYAVEANCGKSEGEAACEVKPDACDLIYAPVCGCDGKTYANSCDANRSGVSVQHEGACSGPTECTAEAKICPDGSAVGRVPPSCEFAACPTEPVPCDQDAKLCPDGTTVGRVPPSCEFAPCPEDPVACTEDAMECPDGSYVSRVPPSCEFAPCPDEPVACATDAKLCSDGSGVGRVGPCCEFPACPGEDPIVCAADVQECPDGSFVERLPPCCVFAPCP